MGLVAWRRRPAILQWRQTCADDPLTSASGLLVWGLVCWWLVPAFGSAPGSLITRIVALQFSLGTIRVALVLLAVLGAAGAARCWPTVARAAAVALLIWWMVIWVLAVTDQPWSTTTGSYGLVAILSLIHVRGVSRSTPACATEPSAPVAEP